MVPGVLRLGFAQGDEEDGIENRDQRQGCQGGPVKGLSGLAAEAEQVHQRPNGHQGDSHIAPEAGGIVLQAVGDGFHPVHRFKGGHKAHHQGNGGGDDRTPGDGPFPVDPVVFQGQHRGHGHHQGQHVIPSGIEGGIHHLEGGVEEGHQRHEEQNPQEFLQPVLPAHLQPANYAGHTKQGQPGSQRGPFGAGIRGEVGPGGQIRREEETGENVQIPLDVVVQHRVPAVDVFAGAVVLQHRHHRGHQQRAGEAQAQHSLQPQEEKIFQADAPAFAEQPYLLTNYKK